MNHRLFQVTKVVYLQKMEKKDIIQRTKEAKIMFINKKQLLCSNNCSLEMKRKHIKSCIWSVAVCGSETWTVGRNEEGIINVFETWSWRRMLKIKWTDRITKDEVFQRAKGERVLLKILEIRRHSWIGHTFRHKKFLVNVLEGAIFGEKGCGKTWTAILKASQQKHSS